MDFSDYNTAIPRLDKAIKLIGNVCNVSPGKFMVQSESDPHKFYEIFDNVLRCECADSSFRNIKCWHVYAVELYKKRNVAQ